MGLPHSWMTAFEFGCEPVIKVSLQLRLFRCPMAGGYNAVVRISSLPHVADFAVLGM